MTRKEFHILGGDLIVFDDELRALFLDYRVLLVHERFEFRDAQPVEIEERSVRGIHVTILPNTRDMSSESYARVTRTRLRDHTSISGAAVRTGCLQSIPSSNIDS